MEGHVEISFLKTNKQGQGTKSQRARVIRGDFSAQRPGEVRQGPWQRDQKEPRSGGLECVSGVCLRKCTEATAQLTSFRQFLQDSPSPCS